MVISTHQLEKFGASFPSFKQCIILDLDLNVSFFLRRIPVGPEIHCLAICPRFIFEMKELSNGNRLWGEIL
ncbi:MAG: hypothetical protein COV67_12155 [Nitrospinae bacterium CG11_big_fil_rev_8_21_14_0_20_56_8]|nr:MAG: hypothetical protein COV67_12155 [Nitrospinae bacterium CG11_big_fil_rev_8_21_14_0_20_56_8]